ncbi:hypothetical protein N0B44_29830 [Roseibacterium beibuensis]|uniref:beta strand repeat-containing protein n=1 Tax=[Roseibacterium] beibuensis TaxID=1193142 RepID=UPI00217F072E|nr:calcium-binding protein [Roseibacterium beibuensis]MCS6627121.1 hypothetical protein [Roseibacterium beibuensis]
MPTISVASALDMTALSQEGFLDILAVGVTTIPSGGEVIITRNPGAFSERYIFSGSGFGSPGANGFPTTGTITGLLIEIEGIQTLFEITGLSVTVAALNAALASSDPQDFLDLVFGAADTVNGANTSGIGEILEGQGGDDVINGYDGQDLISGGGGNDTLDGGDETGPTASAYGDAIDGGAGDDLISGGGGRDLLLGGDGADTINGGADNDLIYDGGAGFESTQALTFIVPSLHEVRINTVLDGSLVDQSVDILNGGAGNDSIVAGLGDILDGGDGIDTAVINFRHRGSALQLDLSAAPDTGAAIAAASGGSYSNIELFTVRGTDFGDALIGSAENNVFYGGAGADLLEGRDGVDQLIGGVNGINSLVNGQLGGADDDGVADDLLGGEGNDVIHAGVYDRADGGNGTDTLYITLAGLSAGVNLDLSTGDRFATLAAASGATLANFENLSFVVTTGFDDVLTVAHGGNYYMLDGDDAFEGNDLAQFVGGNAGNDVIRTYGGADRLWGGDGDDHLEGGDGDDFLYADEDNVGSQRVIFAGNDVIDGGAGNDQVAAGGGDDLILGGAGVDLYDGGEGVDTVDYSTSAQAVQVSLASFSTGSGGDAQGDQLISIENLTGSALADSLTGDGNTNVLSGGAGGDTLNGEGGDDALRGGAGVDTLNGGDGYDTADYSTAAAGVVARIDLQRATNDGDGGTDTFTSIESITGSSFNDTLIGGGVGDVLRGGLGSDVLLGLGGNDVLWGGSGAANQLQGGTGDDTYVLEAYDTIVEAAGQGTDTVDARINTYVLANNVENLIFGGTGDFAGTGNAAANVITGGAGADVLRGRGGTDTLNGGLGIDTADYTLAAAGVVVRLDLQRATNDGDGATDTFTSIENAIGSNFNDVMFGDGGNNLIQGGNGSDVLLGMGGDDILMGGSGGVNNQLQGGAGNDWYILDAFDTCVEFTGEGTDTVEARIGTYTLGNHIENLLYTGPGKFVGGGNALNNQITGGALNDILRGKGGNDTIDGGLGVDEVQLRGVAANYTITAEGNGYRIVDSVPGRDGSTFVTSIEVLRYANNTVTVLSYPPAAAGIGEATGKSASDDAWILPGLMFDKAADDDAFVLPALPDDEPLVLPGLEAFKAGDEPLVLPGAGESTPLLQALEARLALAGDRMLTLNSDGRLIDEPAHRDIDWLF